MIESVPNVSEGRRPDVIRALVDAVGDIPGVHLLNCSSDPDHNRSVLTLVGDGDGLTQALLRLFDIATTQIDLRVHRGEHPRIGAVDVVPFVPLKNTTMTACADLARSVGQTVADQFDIPVYLYEEAAAAPNRRRLEDIRRGQFEGLATKMVAASWHPDFGPSIPHPTAGASAIGARRLLIALNVNLDTDDLKVAQQIARTVRARSGGLPFVKAIAVQLTHRHLVQVSMNLTDHVRTPLHLVCDAVKREADKLGVAVANSEVVGMVPADVLVTPAVRYLQLDRFTPDQVLETQLPLLLKNPSPRSFKE